MSKIILTIEAPEYQEDPELAAKTLAHRLQTELLTVNDVHAKVTGSVAS